MNHSHQYRIIKLQEVDSTNSWAKSAFAKKIISDGAAIVAETQNAGRGQMQTKWHDESGKNLLFTLIASVDDLAVSNFFKLNEAASMAIVDVLAQYITVEIKWPNDIFVGNKKIAGILIETNVQGNQIKSAFIGIGLNVNQRSFPDEIRATSMAKVCEKEFELPELLDKLLAALQFRLSQLQVPNMLEQSYFRNVLGKEKPLKYRDKNGDFYAKVKKVETDGRLVLEVENEETYRYYQFKEVQLIL